MMIAEDRRGSFFLNDLPGGASKNITIPVDLKDFKQAPGIFKNYTGNLETVVKYNEFYDDDSSVNEYNLKNELLTFPYMP